MDYNGAAVVVGGAVVVAVVGGVVCCWVFGCLANVRHAVKQFICRQFSYDYKQFPLFSV